MTAAAAAPPADVLDPTGFSSLLLNLSVSGVLLMRPCYEASGEIVDFDGIRLNLAAQQMLRLPECPAETFRALYPTAQSAGVFDFYREAFRSDTVARRQNLYQFDGLDGYFLLVAQRYQDLLVVSFTDTNDQPRSAVEDALRESQAAEQAARAEAEHQRLRFYEVLMQLPATVAVYHGPTHAYQFVNARYQRIFPLRSFAGRPFRDAMPESVGLGMAALFDQVYQRGEPFHGHEVEGWFDFDGTGERQQLFFNLYLHPLRNAQGEVDGLLDFAYDVTEQVRARQQVEQLNQELETRVAERTETALALQADLLEAAQRQVQMRESFYQVFEQTTAAVALLRGPDHRYEYVNAAYRGFAPYRPLVGGTIAEELPELYAQGFGALLDRVYQTGETYFGVELPFTPDPRLGEAPRTSYFNFTYQAYRENGEIAGVSIFAFEVTEQVLARRAREAQQLLLNLVFEQAPLPIFVATGPTFVLEVINAPAARLFHKVREQLLGLPYAEAFPEFMQQGFGELLRDVWQSGQARTFTDVPVYFLNRPPGEPGYFTFVYQPLRDAQGQVHGIVCVGIETTDQVLARQQVHTLNEELAAINEELTATNEELNESNTRLTRTNVDLDTFVYTASHDLKAPITNIEGILYALRDTLPPAVQQDDLVAHLLGLLDNTVGRFQTTIHQLTDLSRLQQRYNEPTELLLLAPVVADVLTDLAPAIAAAAAQVQVAVPADLQVSFAPASLRSVVYNLLSNAVKYRDPARPAQVWLTAERRPQAVVLTVRDNGLGLTETQQTRLFGVFQRLHTHVEGTGVGLYMIKRLIENAGATIAVVSAPAVGSTFTVTFPA